MMKRDRSRADQFARGAHKIEISSKPLTAQRQRLELNPSDR
jgi:hypothetical protein